MDRVNGTDWFDIGGGKRGFRSQNAGAGVPGTEVTADWLNAIQEEILKVIEAAGLVPNAGDMTQLWQALDKMVLPGFAGRQAWMPVLSVTTVAPPVAPATGDVYIVPAGATGAWAGQNQMMAIWTGAAWVFIATADGHGVSLPNGRVFVRVGGSYIELAAAESFNGLIRLATAADMIAGADASKATTPLRVASAVQAGVWSYAVAGGTANAITATLTPAPLALASGMVARIKITATNTGSVSFNANGLGTKWVVRAGGVDLMPGDFVLGSIVTLIYDAVANVWYSPVSLRSDILKAALAPLTMVAFTSAGTTNWPVPDGVQSIDVELWGAGGGGGYTSVGGAPGGGGAGGYARRRFTVNPGQSVAITVGAGGVGGAVSPARDGQPGTFSSVTVGAVTVRAEGGTGGENATLAEHIANEGFGGDYSGADFGVRGGNGGLGMYHPAKMYGGYGGSAPIGGQAVPGGSGSPGNGFAPGGGGGATSLAFAGGNGGLGLVRISYN